MLIIAIGTALSLGWLAWHYQLKYHAACEEIEAAYDWIDEIVEALQAEEE